MPRHIDTPYNIRELDAISFAGRVCLFVCQRGHCPVSPCGCDCDWDCVQDSSSWFVLAGSKGSCSAWICAAYMGMCFVLRRTYS